MNKPIILLAAIALLSVAAGGCASYPSYNSYGGGYGYGGYNSGYGGGYGGRGYNDRYGYSGRAGQPYNYNYRKQEAPTKQETSVKALRDAAKRGADPASTLYQQLLIQQQH